MAIKNGTNGNDSLPGTAEDDSIYGLGGNDTIRGDAGDDHLYGESITWIGVSGNDQLFGDDGMDWIEGGGGNDTIEGGAGNDHLFGGDGDDTIRGDLGTNILFGDAGNDALFGGNGANELGFDLIWGGIGNDILYGFAGNDLLHGDDGDDRLIGGPGDDQLSGESGVDTAIYLEGLKSDFSVIKLEGLDDFYMVERREGSSSGLPVGRDILLSVEFVEFLDGVFPIAGLVVDGPDTKDLKLVFADGQKWQKGSTGEWTATGSLFIRHKDSSVDQLKLTGGAYTVANGQLVVSGADVVSVVDGGETSLFTGGFELSLSAPSGVVHPTAGQLKLAGLDVQLGAIGLTGDSIRLTTSFTLPDLLLGTPVGLSGEVLVLSADGSQLSLGGAIDLAKYLGGGTGAAPIQLLGKIGATVETLELGYAAFEDRLYIKGGIKLFSFPASDSDSAAKPLLSLNEAEIGIKDGEAYGKGVIKSADFSFGGGWGLSDVEFSFDSTKNAYTGKASLGLPLIPKVGELSVDLGFKYEEEFFLDKLVLEAKLLSPGLPIGTTGVFLRSLGGGAENLWSKSTPIVWDGTIGLDWMKQVLKLRFEAKTDFDSKVEGKVSGGILVDDLGVFGSSNNPLGAIKFEGNGSLNWNDKVASLDVTIDIVNTLKGTARISASDVGSTAINANGQVSFELPGTKIKVVGNLALRMRIDNDPENDYAAAWVTVSNPLYGLLPGGTQTLTRGIRIDLDGDFSAVDDLHVFGASEVALYSSWIVDASVKDLMVTVAWTGATLQAVQTRVIVYDDLAKTQVRQVINEEDFGANGVAVIDAWSGPNGKVIYIGAPLPGLWDVEVVNPIGLGDISYSATTSLKDQVLDVSGLTMLGQDVTISFDAGARPLGEVLYFVDSDDHGFDGMLLGQGPADVQAHSHTFSVSALAPGIYWLYGVLDDGAHIPASDYSPKLLHVRRSGENHAPTAAAAVAAAREDTVLSGSLPIAEDPDFDPITYSKAGDPLHGEVSIGTDGTYTYIPAHNFNGIDTIAFKVADDRGGISTYAVALTVAAVNDPPTGTLTISGSARLDEAMVAQPALTDVEGLGTFSFQWLLSGVAITGASAASYTAVEADIGLSLSVRVSYTDGAGNAESITTTATTAVLGFVALNGTTGDNGLNGGAGTDSISGLGGNDALSGLGGRDKLFGGDGTDALNGGTGNDTLDGGAGIDTGIFSDTRASSSLAVSGSGWSVTAAGEGTDSLLNVERLKFSDAHIALDLNGSAGIVAKILGAVFGAPYVANKDYFGIGLYYSDGGMSYEALMQLALDARLGANASHVDVVTLLYTNVVGVGPGPDDLAYFVGELDSHRLSPARLGKLAGDHFLNIEHINLVGLTSTGVEFIPYVGG